MCYHDKHTVHQKRYTRFKVQRRDIKDELICCLESSCLYVLVNKPFKIFLTLEKPNTQNNCYTVQYRNLNHPVICVMTQINIKLSSVVHKSKSHSVNFNFLQLGSVRTSIRTHI